MQLDLLIQQNSTAADRAAEASQELSKNADELMLKIQETKGSGAMGMNDYVPTPINTSNIAQAA